MQRGRYNAVLTGAAFLDAHTALPAYWADQYAAARAAVDEVFNGEDLLMNYVLASRAPPESPPPVKFYQPKVRVGVFERASLYLFRVSFFFALGFSFFAFDGYKKGGKLTSVPFPPPLPPPKKKCQLQVKFGWIVQDENVAAGSQPLQYTLSFQGPNVNPPGCAFI